MTTFKVFVVFACNLDLKYLICFQYKDDKLPDLEYGPNHMVIERSFNNSAGKFPYVTRGEKV